MQWSEGLVVRLLQPRNNRSAYKPIGGRIGANTNSRHRLDAVSPLEIAVAAGRFELPTKGL